MTSEQEQTRRPIEEREERRGIEELPLQSSPYVKYTDLEDYKQQAYGTQGHLPVVADHAGGTDAPTLSGSGLSEGQVQAADLANRHGAV